MRLGQSSVAVSAGAGVTVGSEKKRSSGSFVVVIDPACWLGCCLYLKPDVFPFDRIGSDRNGMEWNGMDLDEKNRSVLRILNVTVRPSVVDRGG